MTIETLHPEVSEQIDRWLGAYELLYYWERDETYFIVAKSDLLYFLRVFKIGDEWVISQDAERDVASNEGGRR